MLHSELITKSEDELVTRLEDLKKELFNLRLKKTHSQLENPSQLRLARREVARILHILSYHRNEKIKTKSDVNKGAKNKQLSQIQPKKKATAKK